MAPPPVVYAFGEFHLDGGERVLRRGSVTVPLTPKATEILFALIERRGHIVEKADLMQQVWPDTAVEEGNLSQNIYTLRRVLAGVDGRCPYIETVPRRGYRFAGTVHVLPSPTDTASTDEPAAENDPVTAAPIPAVDRTPPSDSPGRPARWAVAVLGLGLLSGVAWVAFDRARIDGKEPPPQTALPAAAVNRLTNLGNVVRATLTGDGRSLVYAITHGARESLWAKSLGTGNPVQLVEPAVGTYRRGGGLSSAPGGWVYYTWFRPDLAAVGIFRIHRDGGAPEPVANVQDLPAFDPGGGRFACITTTSMPVGESRLLVYDAGGHTPRVAAMRRPPVTFLQMRPAWAPDGRHLAAWTSSAEQPGIRDLVIVNLDDGRDRVAARKRLHAIDGMVWLQDGSGVVVAARESASAPLRLWRIALDSGVMQLLTTDISDYLLAGITGEGQRLAAVRVEVSRTLWVARMSDLSRARQASSDAGELSELESLSWTPDNRILYTSTESGNADIWMYDPEKDTRTQLTTHPGDDFNPATSEDGRTIVFASDRSGASGIWAMSGSGEQSVRQLTAAGDSRPTVAGNESVVFQRGVIQSAPIELWRVPLSGGAAARVAPGVTIRPTVSPDGRMVAYYWLTPERWTLAVAPLSGNQPVQVFPLSSTHCGRTLRWSPDSRSLAYIDCEDGVANIWRHHLDGSPPRRLTDFPSGQITTFDWSRDGSQLAWLTRNQVSDVVLVDLPATATVAGSPKP